MVSELFTHLSNKWKNGGGNRSPPPVACHVIDWQMSVSELKTIKRRLFTLDDPQMVAVYHLWSSFLLFCGGCGGGGGGRSEVSEVQSQLMVTPFVMLVTLRVMAVTGGDRKYLD